MKVPESLAEAATGQQNVRKGMSDRCGRKGKSCYCLPAEIQTALQRYQSDGKDFLDGTPKQIEQGLFYFGEIDNVGRLTGFEIEAASGNGVNAPGANGFLETARIVFETPVWSL